MRRLALRRTVVLVSLLLASPVCLRDAAGQTGLVLPGVVVETVDVGSAPYRAGIRSGDVLIGWSRVTSAPGERPVRGRFKSPFDLKPFELEEVPRGAHALVIERAGRRLTLVNSPGPWTDMTVRSNLAGEALKEYERGLEQVGQTYGGRVTDEALIEGHLTVNGTRINPGERVKRQDFEAGLKVWELLASHLSGIGEHAAAAWLRWQIAWQLINGWHQGKNDPRLPETETALQAAVDGLRPLECRMCEADLHYRLVHELVRTSQLANARAAFDRALAATERVLPDSPTLAAVLQEYAMASLALEGEAEQRQKMSEALFRRAIGIRDRLTPQSPERAMLLAQFADTVHPGTPEPGRLCRQAWRLVRQTAPLTMEANDVGYHCMQQFSFHGDLAGLEALTREMAGAAERWTPRSRVVTQNLSQYAEALTTRGKLDAAEASARRALDHCHRIEREWAAAGFKHPLIDAARPLTALGDVAYARGDLAAAEDWYRQAIAIIQRRFPDRLGEGALGLAKVFEARGDLSRAEDLYTHLSKELHNGSVPAVTKLARLALARGDLPRAETEANRALSYTQRIMQKSLEHAEVLEALARIASARGDFDGASQRLSEALTMLWAQASGTLAEAQVLQARGELQRNRDTLAEAKASFAAALAIRRRLAPGTSLEAESRHGLALVHRTTHNPQTDADFRLAIAALEHQVGRAGSSDQAKAGTRARNAAVYADYVEWLLESNRRDEAFHVLERSRARSFLASLAERRVRFQADTPPALAAERARAEVEYDQLQALIAAVDPTRDKERLAALIVRLHAVQGSLNAVAERMRASAPRVAAVRYPVALTAPQVRAALDPGTAVLSYAVGEKTTRVFVLPASGEKSLEVITIDSSEETLRRDVDAFRRLIAWKRPSDAQAIADLGLTLYHRLVRPAEPHIISSKRLLIVGDGPLLTLPFSALVRSVRNGTPEYLLEWKPVHSALSVTSYAELRKNRRPNGARPESVVAFGDPLYPPFKRAATAPVTRAADSTTENEGSPEEAASLVRWDDWIASGTTEDHSIDPELLVETDRGARLTPLPASREEVMAVAKLYGPAARVYLGAEATEARATALDRTARIVHFAAHGVVNDHLPLNSALALSIPGKPQAGNDNGLLQAWEIYDRMHLDADLVTLSACETALGREARGEGLFGLTRAFLYAGAHSVLASLWRIEDRSTAALMERFYGELQRGQPKDEALRSAQLSLLAAKETSHPYYWAAFQLHGDWK
jgi:CHAT domain-containing protein